jgi:hypothetical protein
VCGAVELVDPAQNWHPGLAAHRAGHLASGGTATVPAPPSSGYYPGDLQSAYGLASAAAAFGPGTSAPTVAVVDAYDDPNAASDLAAYRASLSGATDPNTGLADASIPPLCSSTVTAGCATFKKVNQNGGTGSYPRANTGWAEEISLDLDMISAVCHNCNIVLVEASNNYFSNLQAAVSYAKSLHPAAVTNSYGGGEFSSEASFNSVYSAASGTAVTAATGDNGYGAEYPAAAPGLTAVGGTSLAYSGYGGGLTWSRQTVWSNASGATGSGCSAYESMPSWQNNPSVYDLSGTCAGRQIGDIAAVADPNTGVAVYDTYGLSGWSVFGGTSASTQIIGAAYGLAASTGSFHASPSALYVDAGTANTGSTNGLVQVTSGSNSSCGNYLCDASHSLLSGYNGPTGLGTPTGIAALTGSPPAPPSPDFSISASPSTQSVNQGSATTYSVTITPDNGFAGSVALTAPNPPSGASASFSPSSAAISSTTSVTSTMSITTSSTTPGGSYTLTVTGTSGTLVHSTMVTLVVKTPDFSISTSPSSRSVNPGSGTSYSITITPSNGFTGPVNLKVTGLPSGGGASLSPSSATTSSTMSVTTGSTTPGGTYTLNITGTSGGLIHSSSVTLVVQSAAGGNDQ